MVTNITVSEGAQCTFVFPGEYTHAHTHTHTIRLQVKIYTFAGVVSRCQGPITVEYFKPKDQIVQRERLIMVFED